MKAILENQLIKKFRFYKLLTKNLIDTNIKNFNHEYVELRSDVKTLPTEKMRNSIKESIFGDDAFSEDPTCNRLCQEISKLFGKEKALFVPTGTMGNILSISINCSRDNYVLQGPRSHLFKMEREGQEQMGFKPLLMKEMDELNENFDFSKLKELDQPAEKVRVVAFENSHNYNGGKIANNNFIKNKFIPYLKNSDSTLNHVKFHLDGSRVLNSAAALGVDPKTLVSQYDTVNVCLSKGMGAPCGSVILFKNEEDYLKGRLIRKNIGGAMRQAGFLAAPALVALEDWRERFEGDHFNAKLLADGLSKIKGLIVSTPQTNIVNIYIDEKFIKKDKIGQFVERLKDYKVLVYSFDDSRYIRAVLHHQVSRDKVIYSIDIFSKVANSFL